MTRPLECLVIADDLTGACDAAVHFAMRGYRTIASTTAALPDDAKFIAINAETRGLAPAEAEARIREVAAAAPRTRVLFKKIDSVLRGHPERETAAALEAFGCDVALFTPAFPALGRTVRDGWLYVDGERCVEVSQCVKDARIISLDASDDADLDAIVAAGLARRERVLWAGSGGLASALARALPRGAFAAPGASAGPVQFCIGSDHPVMVAQLDRLRAERPDARILAVPTSDAAAVFLCGGDTASAVCQTIGATAIDLCGEIAPGIPRGILRGGAFEGRGVVTKSGGFGDADALLKVVDCFNRE